LAKKEYAPISRIFAVGGMHVLIQDAKKILMDKLKKINVDDLAISDYNKRFMGEHLKDLNTIYTILDTYSYLLSLANLTKDSIVMDYGGGSGLLSLLIKETGAITVYNDIYDVSCHDAQVIANAIGNIADYYIQGDIDDAIQFLTEKRIKCDVIIAYDVIEHIYNITDYFYKLQYISDKSLIVIMASGANSLNPIINRRLMRQQIVIENEDRPDIKGHKERDSLSAYRKIREKIIMNENVDGDDLGILVDRTRGMIESDIIKCVKGYLKTGVLPSNPLHSTNTCDPYTVNWAEHLINPYQLKAILDETGFKAKVMSGYYAKNRNLLKECACLILNAGISFLGSQGVRLAPYYIVYGAR
jgi:hypothetical protein